MKIFATIVAGVVALLSPASLVLARSPGPPAPAPVVSGHLMEGIRVLPVSVGDHPLHLTVYRGDYVKFDLDPSLPLQHPLLTIPDLSIRDILDRDLARAPYFKMKVTGRFPFTVGDISGRIDVIDYRQSRYTEVDAKAAAAFIAESKPFILDVRTPAEYKRGHLAGAVLIPLQDLEKRLGEIDSHKDGDVLVYCATGNRSTVASKILIDNGFQHIINMKHGIAEWAREKFTIRR